MLTAVHTLVYSDDPAATRAFFADVLRWPFVSEGESGAAGVGAAGTGGTDPAEWLIFRTGPSELGVHPTSGVHGGTEWTAPRQHRLALMCDDLDATMAELADRGARFSGEPAELGFGRGVQLQVPGADDLLLYQAHHAIAHALPAADPHQDRRLPRTDEEWEAHYAPEAIWSGDPNGALVAVAEALTPGRAIDVGCGEGADAVWLAERGWDVVGIDVAQSALIRAQDAAEDAGVSVDFRQASLLGADLPAGAFDLVSACYPALRRTPSGDAERALAGLVAPGGRLLLLAHADIDAEHARSRGFDPDDYVDVADVRAVLPTDWTIEVDDVRPRQVDGGAGAGHHTDLVLVARRPSSSGHLADH